MYEQCDGFSTDNKALTAFFLSAADMRRNDTTARARVDVDVLVLD